MPELPEVETTCRGIEPHIKQQSIIEVTIRQHQLRWLIPVNLSKKLRGQKIEKVTRRGKYILFHTTKGTLIIHLGMSGSLRVLKTSVPADKHDHVDMLFGNNIILRFNDPRRFGCMLWTEKDPFEHDLLKNLGPEPLEKRFIGEYLYQISRNRKTAIKSFIMNAEIVVGVGNIYANEALFLAKIKPTTAVHKINLAQYCLLVACIKQVLAAAIKHGGTTIRNFSKSDGKPGYFKQQLNVYGRGGLACLKCNTDLKEIRLGQRTTVYCTKCQR